MLLWLRLISILIIRWFGSASLSLIYFLNNVDLANHLNLIMLLNIVFSKKQNKKKEKKRLKKGLRFDYTFNFKMHSTNVRKVRITDAVRILLHCERSNICIHINGFRFDNYRSNAFSICLNLTRKWHEHNSSNFVWIVELFVPETRAKGDVHPLHRSDLSIRALLATKKRRLFGQSLRSMFCAILFRRRESNVTSLFRAFHASCTRRSTQSTSQKAKERAKKKGNRSERRSKQMNSKHIVRHVQSNKPFQTPFLNPSRHTLNRTVKTKPMPSHVPYFDIFAFTFNSFVAFVFFVSTVSKLNVDLRLTLDQQPQDQDTHTHT